MADLIFNKQDMKHLERVIFDETAEAMIMKYKFSLNPYCIPNYFQLKNKLIKLYRKPSHFTQQQYITYLQNKKQKVDFFSKMEKVEDRKLITADGGIYRENDLQFIALYMEELTDIESLDSLMNKNGPIGFSLEQITNYINQEQQIMKREMHPKRIFSYDLHLDNIVVKNGIIYFLDSDSFTVGDIPASNAYPDSTSFVNDPKIAIPKYKSNQILIPSENYDILTINYQFLFLILNSLMITKLPLNKSLNYLEEKNFPKEYIDYFASLFSEEKNEFVNPDLLDKLSTDYYIKRSKHQKKLFKK